MYFLEISSKEELFAIIEQLQAKVAELSKSSEPDVNEGTDELVDDVIEDSTSQNSEGGEDITKEEADEIAELLEL